MDDFSYDVAISFSGEQREDAEAIAARLRAAGLKVFYDEYETATLWGKDLYEHLATIYQNEAKYCLMLVSASYAARVWTTHERRSAQARALTQKGDYILPVRFDDTEIPGLPPSVGYLRFQDYGVNAICDLLLEKIRGPQRVTRRSASQEKSAKTSSRGFFLDDARNLQAWIPVIECTWGNTQATLVFKPDDPSDGPYLDSLRDSGTQLLLAFKNNIAECRVDDIQHSIKSEDERWTVRVNIKNTDFSPNMEMSIDGQSADEIAEQRARRILLNEKGTKGTGNVNDIVREGFLRGMGVRQQVSASPFPALYQRFGHSPAKFLDIAWVTAAMTLKTAGIVVEVTGLELAMHGKELRVNFVGKRRKQYSNQPATTVTVTGTCILS